MSSTEDESYCALTSIGNDSAISQNCHYFPVQKSSTDVNPIALAEQASSIPRLK